MFQPVAPFDGAGIKNVASQPMQPRSKVIVSEDRLRLGVTRESELRVTCWHDDQSCRVLHMLALITRRVSSRVFACFHKIHIAHTHIAGAIPDFPPYCLPPPPLFHSELFIFTLTFIFFSICDYFPPDAFCSRWMFVCCAPPPLPPLPISHTHTPVPTPSVSLRDLVGERNEGIGRD